MKRVQLLLNAGVLTILGGFLFIGFAGAMAEGERENYVNKHFLQYREEYYSNGYVKSPVYNQTTYSQFQQYMVESSVPIEHNRLIGFGIIGFGVVLVALGFIVGEKE